MWHAMLPFQSNWVLQMADYLKIGNGRLVYLNIIILATNSKCVVHICWRQRENCFNGYILLWKPQNNSADCSSSASVPFLYTHFPWALSPANNYIIYIFCRFAEHTPEVFTICSYFHHWWRATSRLTREREIVAHGTSQLPALHKNGPFKLLF